ncbi:hypothetical protein H0H92_006148 [Tricholoma furcatifolium]|nr:hypothetical protein H0H92_006148 [Tricholoma furcatifolium]
MALVSSKISLEKLLSVMDELLPLVSEKLAPVLKFAPTAAKYLVFLLFLVNIRSWPLAWHFRVFRPVFAIRFQHTLVQLRTIFKSKAEKIKAEDEWLDSISPVGGDPLNYVVRYNTWASIDDSDFNGHLSNSSYGKTLDSSRFKAALAMFPMFFRAGGWMALAATHYNFIREIPMLASYEVRLSVAAWDQKWIYIVGKFVTKPSKKKTKSPPKITTEQPTPPSDGDNSDNLFKASLRTADQISTAATTTPDDKSTSGPLNTSEALKAVAASLSSEPEPDGAILHTISVSQCCFKVGRITVPPALVFAANGFSVPAPPLADGSPASSYSRANPPPHWAQAKAVMSRPLGGGPKKLQALMKGGWRDVPEAERWWDAAMSGAIEEKRRKGLEVMQSLGLGIAGARNL